MPEEILKNFEQKRAEALKVLESKEAGLSPEKQKEILKDVVSEKIQAIQPSRVNQQAAQKIQELQEQPKERQIQILTEMAFEKGIVYAVEIAKNLDNPYLLDEFHDVLVDQLYNKLVEEGKLERI
jgi:DNA-binding transcriptional MerR regulator